MPIATVQLPNGKIAELEVPQGATPEQIESFVMSNPELGGQQAQAPEQPMQSPAELEQIAAKKQAYLQENLPASQGIVGLETVENVGKGINTGLGNAAIGAFQAATDVGEKAASLIERLYFGDNLNMNTIGDRLANQVKQRNELQAQLPTSQRVGVAVGEALPFLTTGVGTGAKVAQVAGKVAGITAGGAVGGAVSSALSPQEQAGLENRAMQTVKGGAVGSAVGAGFGVAGKVASGAVTLGKDVLAGYKARPVEAIAGFTSKPVETLDSISAAIKDRSSNAYKAVRESGAIFKPEAIKSIFAGIDNSLKESGILNPILHSDTIGILNDLKTLAKEKGDAIGLEELDQYRQLLGDVVKKNTDISGKINADALKANIAIDKLDEIVDGLGANALQGTVKAEDNIFNKVLKKLVTQQEELQPLVKKAKEYNNADEFVKSQGKPFFHGTNNKFDEFDIKKIGSQTDSGLFGRGFYFANNEYVAKNAISGGAAKYVKEVYLNIKNPLDISQFKTKKELANYLNINQSLLVQNGSGFRPSPTFTGQFTSAVKDKGHDAVFVNRGGISDEIVVFDPENIKTKDQLINIFNKSKSTQSSTGNQKSSTGNQNSIDLLNTARAEWKRYRKFDAISSIVKRADGDPNRTKALLQNFVNNPKNLRGFSNAEVEALKRAKTNSTSEGLMKAVGKFGFDIGSGRNAGNTALPLVGASIGGFAGGSATAGLSVVVGTIARQAQKLSAKGQIDDVLKLIQGQEPKIASKVIQQLSPKTRDFVLTNILTQTINQ
jgi:hypothetical protein